MRCSEASARSASRSEGARSPRDVKNVAPLRPMPAKTQPRMMTRRINAGEGSLGKLLNDDAFSKALTGATTNFEQLSSRLNRGEGTVGKLMTDDALFKKMNALTDRFDDLMTRLNDGQGTAGQLLKDKQLYENMNKTVNELHALVADIRKDPKKFLNVKVSIF